MVTEIQNYSILAQLFNSSGFQPLKEMMDSGYRQKMVDYVVEELRIWK